MFTAGRTGNIQESHCLPQSHFSPVGLKPQVLPEQYSPSFKFQCYQQNRATFLKGLWIISYLKNTTRKEAMWLATKQVTLPHSRSSSCGYLPFLARKKPYMGWSSHTKQQNILLEVNLNQTNRYINHSLFGTWISSFLQDPNSLQSYLAHLGWLTDYPRSLVFHRTAEAKKNASCISFQDNLAPMALSSSKNYIK